MGAVRQWWKYVVVALCSLMALISISHIFAKAFSKNHFDNSFWGLDFYQFWYAGHFFWQGEEPYSAIQHVEEPDLKEPDVPNYFLDKRSPQQGEGKLHRRWPVAIIPGAAPLFLLIAPFSFLTWVNATIVWSIVNIMLGVILIWLLIRLSGGVLVTLRGALLLSLFFSTIAVRQVIELGQSSLLVAVGMFGALLFQEECPICAGGLLAIATSKFTMGFPVFVYFLYRRWFKGLASCCVIHLLAIAILCIACNANPSGVVKSYLAMSASVLSQIVPYSIHLLALDASHFSRILWGVTALGVPFMLIIWHRRTNPLVRKDMLTGLILVGIGCMWSLLVLYHGRQDMVMAFIFVTLVVLRTSANEAGDRSYLKLTDYQRRLLYLWTIFVFIVWALPLYLWIGNTVYRWVYVTSNIGVLLTLSWLLFKIQTSTKT